MKTLALNSNFTRVYANNGQHAEQVYRYTVTGELAKADNIPHSAGGDCGNVQVKSSRATVCKGTDLNSYLDCDGATEYAYVVADFSLAYIMARAEWEQFVGLFATVTRESGKNGGGEKLRLKAENKAMVEWLARAAQ